MSDCTSLRSEFDNFGYPKYKEAIGDLRNIESDLLNLDQRISNRKTQIDHQKNDLYYIEQEIVDLGKVRDRLISERDAIDKEQAPDDWQYKNHDASRTQDQIDQKRGQQQTMKRILEDLEHELQTLKYEKDGKEANKTNLIKELDGLYPRLSQLLDEMDKIEHCGRQHRHLERYH